MKQPGTASKRHYPVFPLIALLAGCTVGPDYQAPQTQVPAKFGPATATQTASQPSDQMLMQWWTTLNDAKLSELVRRAGEGNLNLQIAEARVREARALRDVVAADFWPQINLGTGYDYRAGSVNAQPQVSGSPGLGRQVAATAVRSLATSAQTGRFTPGQIASSTGIGLISNKITTGGTSAPDRKFNLFQLGFDARWEMDVFGGIRRSVEAADAELAAAREDQHDILVTVTAEVARNYIEVRSLQRRLFIAHENITTQRETLKLSQSRWKAGLTSELDVAQAEAQLYTTSSQIPLLESQLDQAIHRLSVLLGQEPSALTAELKEARPIPAGLPDIPVGLPSDLLRRRPDVRRAERQLAAATARIGVATADLFPKFALTGSFGTQTTDIQHFLDRPSFFWSVGPDASWPIFEGNRIRSNILLREAQSEQLLRAYEQSVLVALQEVSDALTVYNKEKLRYRELAAAVEAIRRALSLANERYAKGLSDFLSVLDSERSLYQSQDLLAQSETTTVTSALAFYKALGGGWPISEQDQ